MLSSATRAPDRGGDLLSTCHIPLGKSKSWVPPALHVDEVTPLRGGVTGVS